MTLGPEDVVELCIHYATSVFLLIGATLAGFLIAKSIGRRRSDSVIWSAARIPVLMAPLLCWTIYISATFELNYTLIMLGSESSKAAEWTYDNRLKQQVGSLRLAVHLAMSRRQEPNVRFYAACLIADMLCTNDYKTVNTTLEQLGNGAEIRTEFFGGNRLTEGFYVPGHDQVQLSPREIVQRRLQLLRGSP